jgi:elongation factor G
MKDRLGANAVAAQIPMGAEANFWGLIDLVTMEAWDFKEDAKGMIYPEVMDEIPDEFKEQAQEKHDELLEQAANFDDDLMEKILEDETPTVDEVKAALRKGVIANKINLVFVGSAYKNKGIQELLDAICDYLPSPLDIPPTEGTDPNTGETISRKADVNEPFAALAFKIMTDPYVGKLTYIRVYSGHEEAGSYVYNVNKDTRERLGRILEMNANDRVDREACSAGDIVACVGLKNTTTGNTLCDENHPIVLESIEFAKPVIDVAVEPKSKAEQEKMSVGLAKLAEEDPTFQVHTDHETGQTIIAGMGELHLEIIIDRLRREFHVDCNVGKPQVAYRETAGHAVKHVQGKFVRQSGGRGQYGDAIIDMEPNEEGKGYEFVDATVGGSIPKEYIPSVDKGIQEALQSGVIAGYPVEDIKVTLVDGSYHEVDSSEAAFKIAGSMAIKKALQESDPVLLEPIERVDVETPEQYMGDVMGNLSSRRGKIEGMEDRSNTKVIRAKVPLAEMFGYATDLRSQTQGRASYTMQFDSYEAVPKNIKDEIVAKNAGKSE